MDRGPETAFVVDVVFDHAAVTDWFADVDENMWKTAGFTSGQLAPWVRALFMMSKDVN